MAILKKNQGYKKIVKEFGITQHQAREISKRKNFYALHTDEIIDENKTYSISKENKHFDFDEFMMEKIKNLRSKKVKLGFEILKSIARKFSSVISGDFSITDYQIRQFIQRSNLSYGATFGESC